MYPSGTVQYNTYTRTEVEKFLKNLGRCKLKFIQDNVIIPPKDIVKQKNVLKVDDAEFTQINNNQKESFKNLSLNYEILFIEKNNAN